MNVTNFGMTIRQAAEKWGVSKSLIVKWISQGRLAIARPGNEILVLDAERPPAAKRGELRPAQTLASAAWKRKKKP